MAGLSSGVQSRVAEPGSNLYLYTTTLMAGVWHNV